jgi:ABC-type Mn2+/Zn2+ transport system ATPase subunit
MRMNSSRPSAGDAGPPAILLKDVSFTANGAGILTGVNLSVDRGSFLLLLGPNGAGKTTLLKLVDGLITPSAGTVEVLGACIHPGSEQAIRENIAYVPQGIDVDTRTPIRVEEVVSIGRLGGRPKVRGLTGLDRKAVESAMAEVGIGFLRGRPYGQLSAGQKQKVSLARALAQEAGIMLLDEPLSNLDPHAQQEVCGTIDHIYASTHKTIVLVTHLLEQIPRTCTQAMFMREGTIEGELSLDRVLERGNTRELYGGGPFRRGTIEKETA